MEKDNENIKEINDIMYSLSKEVLEKRQDCESVLN